LDLALEWESAVHFLWKRGQCLRPFHSGRRNVFFNSEFRHVQCTTFKGNAGRVTPTPSVHYRHHQFRIWNQSNTKQPQHSSETLMVPTLFSVELLRKQQAKTACCLMQHGCRIGTA